jgi:hypothetical protein
MISYSSVAHDETTRSSKIDLLDAALAEQMHQDHPLAAPLISAPRSTSGNFASASR